MKSVKTRAIVLRRTNYSEADRIFQLITPIGKISAIAKASRREKSRLAGGIELFSICEVVVVDGKSDIKTITSSRLIKFYNHIIEDYDKMQFAYLVIKLVSRASESTSGSEWYDLLAETLSGLDSKSLTIEIVQTWFYIKYSTLVGYGLSLDLDIDGNKILSGLKYRYDVGERGLAVDEYGELVADHIKLLRLISTKSLNVLAKIGGTDDIILDCLKVAREHAAI